MASSTSLRFHLTVQGQAAELFKVQTFDLNEAMSECFVLRIEATTSEAGLKYDDLIAKPATLIVEGDDYSQSHFGVVTRFVQYPDHSKDFGRESYPIEIDIEPRFKLAAFAGQNRIFKEQNAQEIVTAVLEGYGWKEKDDFRFDLRENQAKREYTVQYNESDFNFVSRLMEEEGVFYFFDHSGKKEELVFGDHVNAIAPIPHTPSLIYQPAAGMSHLAQDHITHIKQEQRLVTKSALVTDYNERTPSLPIIKGQSSGQEGKGEVQIFAPHTEGTSAASRWAGIAAQIYQAERVVLSGDGIARSLRPGYRFDLVDGQHSPFEGKYTILRVEHHGDRREGFESSTDHLIYSNHFTCIPAATTFRPARSALRPKIPGVILARVDGQQGDYATIDEEGRYHAKLPFDLTDRMDGQATLPIRLTQPYAGPGYGTHFPLHNGNDIVLSFLDGDVDRPIALGAIPNPSNASPVSSRNKSESVIKTASGHILRMDDLKDKTAVDLTTTGKHILSLNDDKDHQEIRLTTTGKHEMVFDDKNKNIRIATTDGGHQILLDNDKKALTLQTKYGHLITLDDEKKTLSIQTHEGHLFKISDDDKMISLQDKDGKHVLQFDIGGSKVSLTTEGDMSLTAKGSLNIEAKEITMEAKQGAFSAKAMKDLTLQGMNVSAKAQQNLTLEGTVAANLKGLNTKVEAQVNLDLKGGVQTKVTGTMANLEGSAMTSVKGAIVMIN